MIRELCKAYYEHTDRPSSKTSDLPVTARIIAILALLAKNNYTRDSLSCHDHALIHKDSNSKPPSNLAKYRYSREKNGR